MLVILEHVPLASLTTFRVGGKARYFAIVHSDEDTRTVFSFARKKRVRIFILGGGSNIIIPDAGFSGIVVKAEQSEIVWAGSKDYPVVYSGAGVVWDNLVEQAVMGGFSGIENLSLIPGTVGGAICQNIGAYGTELESAISRVRVYDSKTDSFRDMSRDDCLFGYRDSIFKKRESKNLFIVGAEFQLKKEFEPNLKYPDLARIFQGKQVTLEGVRNAVIAVRRMKIPYPNEIPNAGSFFKNPIINVKKFNTLKRKFSDIRGCELDDRNSIKLSAGQLIELAGFKGYRKGSVGVSKKHALVLVNYGNAKAKNILALSKDIQISVHKKFGIRLDKEVQVM